MTDKSLTTYAKHQPDVERIHTFEAPRPGTYWAASKAIKQKWNDRLKIHGLDKGDVVLLIDVVVVDGSPHTYVLAAHPAHGRDAADQKVHVDDFHNLFEPAANGGAVRAAEIQALQAEIAATQRAILAPPPEERDASRLQLPHEPAESAGTALVTPSQVSAMTRYAAELQHRAKSQAEWVEKQTKELQQQTGLLARYYSEAAQVQLARAKAQLAGVEGILKTVENLRLYTGEDVEVITLRTGAAAPADEPLTIYQEILAFDEETAILVENGGLDHTKVKALVEALQDMSLIERMVPAKRGVSLVKFRRTYKEFIEEKDTAAAEYNSHMSRISMTNRLLVRDGEQVYLVSVTGVLDGLEQLLTSAGEQANYFNRGGEDIRHEHLSFAKARASQLNNLEKNARALIVLWGLRDRQEIFAGWQAPLGASWLDPNFQNHWLRLLSIDTLIGVERPSYDDWQEDQNKTMAPGSWIAIHSHLAGDIRWEFDFKDVVSIAQVFSEKGALVVRVPVQRRSGRPTTREMTAVKVVIKKEMLRGGVLCLDRASAPDLDYYLTSRRQRREYANFITLFKVARQWVADRDERELPTRRYLADAAAAAGMTAEAEVFDRAMTEAIAAARLSMKDAKVPPPGSAAHKNFIRMALDVLYAKVRGADQVVALAEAHFGPAIAKLVMHREGYTAYWKPSEEQIDPRLRPEGVYHATPFRLTPAGIEPTAPCTATTLLAKRGEETLHEWAARDEQWRGSSTPEAVLACFDEIHGASQAASELLTKEGAGDLIAAQLRFWRFGRSRFIRRMAVGIPVGTVRWTNYRRDHAVLFAVADALTLAESLGGKFGDTDAAGAIKKWYSTPENALDKLRKGAGASPWQARLCWEANLARPLKPMKEWENINDAGFWLNDEELKKGQLVITTATELGVKLLPDILEFVKAPTRAKISNGE